MSESKTRRNPAAEEAVSVSPRVETADPLQESLDELARMADALVDGLALDEAEDAPPETDELPRLVVTSEQTPAALPVDESPLQPLEQAVQTELAEPSTEPAETQAAEEATNRLFEIPTPTEATEGLFDSPPQTEPVTEPEQQTAPSGAQEESTQSRRESLKETLDALNDLIDDPEPPLTSAEVQVGGDRGEDIGACLDKAMSAHDEEIEQQAATTDSTSGETANTDLPKSPEKDAPPVAPHDPTEETEVETAVAVGRNSILESESSQRSTGIWWLVAVVVIIAALAGTYWFSQMRSSPAPAATIPEVPLPESPVVYTKRPTLPEPTQSTTSADSPTVPLEPNVIEEAPTQTSDGVSPQRSASPAPTDPIAPTQQPAVETVSAPATETTAPVTEAPSPAPTRGETAIGGTLTTPRGRATETGPSRPQAAAVAGIALPEIFDAVEPVEPEPSTIVSSSADDAVEERELMALEPSVAPAEPTYRPPVVLESVEPVFDRRSLDKGETETVALRVLVDERGRVVRVVAEESVSGSDAEFAAINAVLRWSYEPALDAGKPTRSWTTERFEFSRPDQE